MVAYHEYAPPPRLAAYVECFWSLEGEPPSASPGIPHLVLPDTCEDIIFLPDSSALVAVGTMTRAQRHAHSSPVPVCGVRFHPAMARPFLGVPGQTLTDATVALEDLWGARGSHLRRRLTGAATVREQIALLTTELSPPARPSALQHLIQSVRQPGGPPALHELSQSAGISARHLRRVFLEQTGLSPKLFCRVLRFRRLIAALSFRRGQSPVHWPTLALDHGYYDQSHLANDFRAFSGLTPVQYLHRR